MALTLLLAGSAVAIAFLCVMTVRGSSPALASEQTAIGLGSATTDTLSHGTDFQPHNRIDWQMTTVADLRDAEDLLDCLENQGIEERELVVLGNSCFAVRWR